MPEGGKRRPRKLYERELNYLETRVPADRKILLNLRAKDHIQNRPDNEYLFRKVSKEKK